jgi:predicted nucleic acid-binding protein
VALDTNAYSDWRKTGEWGEVISGADEVFVPSIVLGELRFGFAQGGRAALNEQKLTEFLASPVVHVGLVGERTSQHYARLKDFLKKNGTPIPENDIWIASCALEVDATLLTRDRHFNRLPQVSVLWPEI